MGPPPRLDVGLRGGLLLFADFVNTEVIVYVYLSVVSGMQAFWPREFFSGEPRS